MDNSPIHEVIHHILKHYKKKKFIMIILFYSSAPLHSEQINILMEQLNILKNIKTMKFPH